MFTHLGNAAKARVCAITGEGQNFDPYGGFYYQTWNPAGTRIGFNQAIRNHIIAIAPREPNPGPDGIRWITCAYCNWEYPPNRIQVDHVINWATYSLQMTNAMVLGNARTWEVYIGCNDPANLVAACDSCNASKGNRNATQQWIQQRRGLANMNNGF